MLAAGNSWKEITEAEYDSLDDRMMWVFASASLALGGQEHWTEWAMPGATVPSLRFELHKDGTKKYYRYIGDEEAESQ